MSVASSYAKALYEAAKEGKISSEQMDSMEKEMDVLNTAILESKEARVALLSPVTTRREKVSLIEQICREFKVFPLLTQFMTLLARKGRLSLLNEIRDSFSAFRLTLEGGVAGKLVSAEQMNEADVGILAKAFSQKLGKKVAFQVSTNPSLLAGMKVTVNGVTYDGTLHSQLQKLRDRIVTGFPGAHA